MYSKVGITGAPYRDQKCESALGAVEYGPLTDEELDRLRREQPAAIHSATRQGGVLTPNVVGGRTTLWRPVCQL
jgi:hypothetical protein